MMAVTRRVLPVLFATLFSAVAAGGVWPVPPSSPFQQQQAAADDVWPMPSSSFQQQQQQTAVGGGYDPAAVGSSCYRTVQNPYIYFGTKTTYGAVAGNDLTTPPSECRPMQVWMVSRHGTRYPPREKIEKLKKLNELKMLITADTTLCAEDVAAIKNWNTDLTMNQHNMLQRQGIEELKSLAIRLKRHLPQIFNTPYNETKFKFLTSPKQRAVDSSSAFYQALFNSNPETSLPVVQNTDDRLNLAKCKQVYEDKGDLEVDKFERGPLVQSVLSRVSMAMGLKQNLSYENVSLMLDSCKYEKAWYIQSRPAWCAVFSQKDLEILEYLEDLKYYYSNGYGNALSEAVGCPVLNDLINNFKNLARDKTGPLGIFYFGHTPNILSLVAALGIGKDNTPLLSTNFEQMKDRKWRVSFLDPFASNVIAVFYRCRDGNKATILLNEHAIPMKNDRCKLCPWEPIEGKFATIISNQSCNLDFCKNSARELSKSLILIFLAYVCVSLNIHI